LSAAGLALFDLDGTLLDGDTDELWCAFLIDEGSARPRDLRAAQPQRRRALPIRPHRSGRVLRLLRIDPGRAHA
jgi:phosphoserine phosphatase